LSGPFVDRIDLTIEVPAVPAETLAGKAEGESSASVRERVEAAWAMQQTRQNKPNARLNTQDIDLYCTPDEGGAKLLQQAATRLGFSARAWHRVLKVARTIADLSNSPTIGAPHIAEAVQYRRFARN
jgi:magnesium chelatase family protein